MGNRGIVFVASIALLALAGCATHQGTDSVARSTESDVPPSTLPADLVGTWSGSSVPVGAGPGGAASAGGDRCTRVHCSIRCSGSTSSPVSASSARRAPPRHFGAAEAGGGYLARGGTDANGGGSQEGGTGALESCKCDRASQW